MSEYLQLFYSLYDKAKKNVTESGEASETEGDKEETDEDSWAKLGDTISSYFGAKDGEEKKDDTEKSDSKDSDKGKK